MLSDGDRAKVRRSLSDSSSEFVDIPTMPGDKPSAKPTDAATTTTATIEACVAKHLQRTDVFDGLVAKLKMVVEDAVRAALTAANKEISRLSEEVARLKGEMKTMEEVHSDRADDLEQYTRRPNLRVYGIPEADGEDTDQQILRLCHDRLGVDLGLAAISRSHRVGKKITEPAPDGRPRQRGIIVRFVSYRDRQLVYEAKKKLKGTGVVVKEDLTSRRLEVYRRAVEVHGQRSCWSSDGRIFWVDKSGRRGMATKLKDIKK